jgi:hypothetical protein
LANAALAAIDTLENFKDALGAATEVEIVKE